MKIFLTFLLTISIVEAIIGGESVINPNEFPWVVGVRTESGKCGGTIITKNLVITAAHCLFNSKNELDKDVSILFGHSDISSALIKRQRVESTLVHPQHGNKKYYNDVALLRLSKDLEFDDSVQPIGLPTNGITGDLLLLSNEKKISNITCMHFLFVFLPHQLKKMAMRMKAGAVCF